MDYEDLFEEFRYKDLSGIKKFNFKKTKPAKLPEKEVLSLKGNVSKKYLLQSKTDVSPTETLDFKANNDYSPPKSVLQKGEDTMTSLHLPAKVKLTNDFNSTNNPAKCLAKFTFKRQECNDTSLNSTSKLNILPGEGKFDTVLDDLYKNTISNKRTLDISEIQKLNPKLSLNKIEPIEVSLLESTAVQPSSFINDFKQEHIDRSPSLLVGPKRTLKGTFNISKYFNNRRSGDTLKMNVVSPCLTPFKKIFENKKFVSITDVKQISSPDKINTCITSDTIEDSKPITISDTSSTTTDSPILKPKKFIFKKIPLSSSSSSSVSQKTNHCTTTNMVEEKAKLTVSSSDLNSSTIEKPSRNWDNGDILDIKEITSSKHLLNVNLENSERNNKVRNSLKVDKVEEALFLDGSLSNSQSLDITDDDFMDDEEFERRFGSFAEQFDESVLSSKQNNLPSTKDTKESQINTPSTSVHHDTEELLKDISLINWNDNCFEEEPLLAGFKDRDDDSDEFKGNYEHSEVMLEILHQKFGLRSFRPHQKEVINASLKQHDCFVLMPTGGGKSLCYQLPAVLMPGVTVVISPLRALISDQVDKLNALDIAAAHLCSNVSKAECEQIYMKLSIREPTIKLLYLTPEKISASRVIIDILQSLYQRGKLGRFVIDEVHCLSQWGHDFRPDYKQLSMLRNKYKDVPIICLTATATKQVEQDVINILGLKKVKRFIRSFNRPNIKYQVIPKIGKGTSEEIANLIKSKFPKKSGIVYCFSRQDCDNLAEKFNSLGIKSKPYHAGMNDEVREVIQREWMQDRFHVIVATIAFGMGIDKPDVRFVIHNSIPKSVEAFYQESGRAGRDGEVSYSYLFYSYSDVARLQKLMQKDRNMSKKTLDAHKENLKQMVSFAENVVDCRRHLQLIHLGEHFNRRICIANKATICDNCENIDNYKTMDVTKEAKELCSIVKDLTSSENVTMLYVADIYRGAKIKKILERGHNKHPQYGAGASKDKNDVQRILKDLILKNILNDFCTYTGDFPVVYIKSGPKFYQFFNSDLKLHISVCTKKQVKKEVVKVDAIVNESRLDKANDRIDSISKTTTATTTTTTTSGVVRHTIQKQNNAKLQAVRKLQLSQLKVQCHEELLEECRRLAMERNLTLSSVMNLSAIKTMSDMLPNSKEEMLKIQHITNANYNKYGEFFLKITQKFRVQHDALLPLTILSKPIADERGKMGDLSDDEYQSDFYPTSSQEITPGGAKRGVKRKGGSGAKKRTYKKRKVFRKRKKKASSPHKAVPVKSSGWKSKGGGSGKLTLMPLKICKKQ